MKTMIKAGLAACVAVGLAIPAIAQEEEEARTTWRVTLLDVSDGGMDRWQDIMLEHVIPAQQAAGLPVTQLHWIAPADKWDMILVQEMPRGMASFDTHDNPERRAMFSAMVEQEGSEEAVRELFAELNGLEDEGETYYTHTHP